jgi:Lon-like ATP-dependent protease
VSLITTAEAPKPYSQINFLHSLLPDISLTNVSNVNIQPYEKDSQIVRAVMGELISVFKDIAQLQPIFREQSEPSACLLAVSS